MANLRTNNLSGEGGRNAISGSVYFSGYIDGDSADYLTIADTDDLDIGTGDFTFECWVRAAESSGEYAGIFGPYNYDNAGVTIQLSNTGKLRVVNPTAIDQEGSTVIIPQDGTMGDWHHIAVTRASGTIKGYVNGIEEISHSYSSAIDFCNGGFAVIGVTDRNDYPGDFDLKGFISNLRVCKGHAVYTGEFTPPTSPLTVHYNSENDKTSLLCCQDSDNPLQEATGKTIAGYGRHPSQTYDANGEGPELVTSTGVWTLSKGGSGSSNFTVTENGQKLSATTVTSGYVRATYTGLNPLSKYRVKVTLTAGDNNNFGVQGYDKDGNTVTGYFPATDGTAGSALQVGNTYVFEASGVAQWQITGTAWNTLYTFDDVSIKQIPNEVSMKVTPPYGVDAGNTFNGAISMNSPSWMYFPTGRTEERGGTRACWFRGYTQAGANDNTIDFSEMSSKGNAQDFGDTLSSNRQAGALGSSTRGVFGGRDGTSNVIEFITFSTQSNSLDFGDFTAARGAAPGTASDGTRGLFFGGYAPNHANANIIEYITIASTGNGTDFGDLTDKGSEVMGCASPTRGIRFGGRLASPGNSSDVIDYTTIQSAGNATDFGNLTAARSEGGGASSKTRGVCLAGYTYSPNTGRNIIDYITIASTGNAQDFGDLSAYTQSWQGGAGSNNVIIAYGYGYNGSARDNRIDFITIATTGNSVDYGDLTNLRSQIPCATNGHGGLS